MTKGQEIPRPREVASDKEYARLNHHAGRASSFLLKEYSRLHLSTKTEEMERYSDGFGWKGPAKFIRPIDTILEYAPSHEIFSAVNETLRAIIRWPNARHLAYQIHSYIECAGCRPEVVEMAKLVTRIAQEQPYGRRTIGFDLMDCGWDDIRWDQRYEEDSIDDSVFENINRALRDFADRKYPEDELDRYPEPLDNLTNQVSAESTSST